MLVLVIFLAHHACKSSCLKLPPIKVHCEQLIYVYLPLLYSALGHPSHLEVALEVVVLVQKSHLYVSSLYPVILYNDLLDCVTCKYQIEGILSNENASKDILKERIKCVPLNFLLL